MGGVETYVREVVDRTRNVAKKRDVRVLTSSMRTHGPVSQLPAESLLDDPIYVQRLHHAQIPVLGYPRLQALNYYIEHHNPDIIHGHGFWYQPADVAARYAQRHGVPFLLHPYYYDHGNRTKLRWQLYKKTIGRRTFEAADVVIVISPFEQELISRAQLPVKRFELIPPGVDSTPFQTQRINPFLKRGIVGPVLFSASRIAEGKGIDDIVRILPILLKTHADVQYVIAGEDFGAQRSLERLAERLGVSRAVHYIGRLSRRELVGAFQHAAVFVHPSHYEAFGIVLAESLCAGTPVVARNTSAVPYVVPHNKAGLLFSTSEECLRHIQSLLGNENLRMQYGQFGRAYVERMFNWDSSIDKILALYEEFRKK